MWLGTFLVFVTWTAPAASEPPDWLEHYDVPPTCPARATFRTLVLRRLVARPKTLERLRVRVDISRKPGVNALRGRVSARDAVGARLSREVADTSCDALAHALSLMVAVTVEEEPHVDEVLGPAPLAIEGAPLAPTAESGPLPLELAPDTEPIAAAAPARLRASFSVEPLLRFAVQSGIAPRLAIGFGAGVALEWSGPGRWRPRLELTAMMFDGPAVPLPVVAGEVEVNALMLSTSLCPLELAGEGWSLRPCFDLDVGRLTASGGGALVTESEVRRAPWLSSGGSLRAGVAPWGGPVHLSAVLGGFLGLSPHEFYFAPDIAAFEVPAGGWRGGVGLAVTF